MNGQIIFHTEIPTLIHTVTIGDLTPQQAIRLCSYRRVDKEILQAPLLHSPGTKFLTIWSPGANMFPIDIVGWMQQMSIRSDDNKVYSARPGTAEQLAALNTVTSYDRQGGVLALGDKHPYVFNTDKNRGGPSFSPVQLSVRKDGGVIAPGAFDLEILDWNVNYHTEHSFLIELFEVLTT